MNTAKNTAIFLILVLFMAINSLSSSAETTRARLLYETQCSGCHTASVHSREIRAARSYADIQAQVLRWSSFVGADWSEQDVSEVTDFLNSRYYQFECPEKNCNRANVHTSTSIAITTR